MWKANSFCHLSLFLSSSSWGRCLCFGWFGLPERPDILPHLQVSVYVSWWADCLRASLQRGRDAAWAGLSHAKEGPDTRRVLREVGVWASGWSKCTRRLCHGRWDDWKQNSKVTDEKRGRNNEERDVLLQSAVWNSDVIDYSAFSWHKYVKDFVAFLRTLRHLFTGLNNRKRLTDVSS